MPCLTPKQELNSLNDWHQNDHLTFFLQDTFGDVYKLCNVRGEGGVWLWCYARA